MSLTSCAHWQNEPFHMKVIPFLAVFPLYFSLTLCLSLCLSCSFGLGLQQGLCFCFSSYEYEWTWFAYLSVTLCRAYTAQCIVIRSPVAHNNQQFTCNAWKAWGYIHIAVFVYDYRKWVESKLTCPLAVDRAKGQSSVWSTWHPHYESMLPWRSSNEPSDNDLYAVAHPPLELFLIRFVSRFGHGEHTPANRKDAPPDAEIAKRFLHLFISFVPNHESGRTTTIQYRRKNKIINIEGEKKTPVNSFGKLIY